MCQQPGIDKIYSYAKDTYEEKHRLSIHKQENAGLKHFSYPKAFFEYSYYMDDIYKNTKEYNPDKKQKILTVFDDMIPHIYSNKRLNPLATELFVRE